VFGNLSRQIGGLARMLMTWIAAHPVVSNSPRDSTLIASPRDGRSVVILDGMLDYRYSILGEDGFCSDYRSLS
jgi:hypothetical protein